MVRTESQLTALFTYHAPTEEQREHYQVIRDLGYELALAITHRCPEGPDREIAVQKVREAIMWANASIATNNAAAS